MIENLFQSQLENLRTGSSYFVVAFLIFMIGLSIIGMYESGNLGVAIFFSLLVSALKLGMIKRESDNPENFLRHNGLYIALFIGIIVLFYSVTGLNIIFMLMLWVLVTFLITTIREMIESKIIKKARKTVENIELTELDWLEIENKFFDLGNGIKLRKKEVSFHFVVNINSFRASEILSLFINWKILKNNLEKELRLTLIEKEPFCKITTI